MNAIDTVYFRTWFVRLDTDHATAEGRRQAATALRHALVELADACPDEAPLAVHIGLPLDAHAEAAWDLCLHMTFTSREHAEICSADDARLGRLLATTPGAHARVTKAWNFYARDTVEAC